MGKVAKMVSILALAVAFCFALVFLAQAGPGDPVTQAQAKNNLRNAKKATPIPIWQITQDGTAKSVQWVDHAPNPRFAVYDPNHDSTDAPATWVDDAVLDKETGLMWERSPDDTLRDWSSRVDCVN